MTLCRFYQQGNCRNGDSCRFEHPGRNNTSTNRFGALSGSSSMNNNDRATQYNLNAEVIQRDLEIELPQWIFSAYGPGKDAPEQLFGGPAREQSAEEVRWHYMRGAATGNPQQALSEIDAMYQAARQQIQHTLSNVNQAIEFIVSSADKHPNRNDICKQSTQGGAPAAFGNDKPAGAFGSTTNAFANTTANSSAFGAPATAGGAFGQASALGQKPNPFGAGGSTPAFGQPAQPAASSAFGQPSSLGSTSAFGRPAQTTSAFGQSSALGAKPNPFGTPAPAFGQSGFAATAQPAASSGFGQPSQLGGGSVFGKPAQPASAFGQPSQPTGAFGQASALGQKPNPFGAPAAASPFGTAASTTASPFAQTASAAQTSSPFGQPATTATANAFGQAATTATTSAFGQPATSSPFGAPATTAAASSPFGQAQAAPSNPFGAPAAPATSVQSSAFSQPATSSPFGASATTQPAANPFGQPATQPATTSAFGGGGAFGTPNTAAPATAPQGPAAQGYGPYGPNASRQHPDPSSYSAKGPDNRLRMWKGRPVAYIAPPNSSKPVPLFQGPNGQATRIWFPDGPPNFTAETEAADPKAYEEPKVKQQWESFMQNGVFEGGVMPEVPPKREFCVWSF